MLNTAVLQTTIGDLHYVAPNFQSPFSVYAVDLDNDGDNDIITGSSTDTIAWYSNNGDGQFSPLILISTELDNIRCVVGCDLDIDGDVDILVASKNDNSISWLKNDGNENFASPIIISNSANSTRFVEGCDMDNDNDIDIVASYVSNIVWFENDGNCNFSDQQIISNSLSYRLSIADMNGDTYNDIVTMNMSGNNLNWFKNNGNKTFTEKSIPIPGNYDYCYDVDVSDINGNDQLDIIACYSADNYYGKIVWFENEGNDNFSSNNNIAFKYGEYERIASGDFDQDGDADVFATSTYYNILYWIKNDELSFHSDEIGTNMAETIDILLTDMDLDNDPDVLISSSNRSKIVWIENLTLEVISQPQETTICPMENTSFTFDVKDANNFTWLVRNIGSGNFSMIEDNEIYIGLKNQ